MSTPSIALVPLWSFAARLTFRFCFLYFGLFCLSNQVLGGLLPVPIDGVNIPDLSTPLQPLIFWIASHIFQVKTPLVYQGSGSGDKTFDWVLTFCLLIIASAVAVAWSALDRKRPNYRTLAKWFRIFIRFAMAGQFISYGFAKAVPLQMPFPYLSRLLEPFGNFSPMGVLWSSVGASPSYEIFTGCAEILAGALLILPLTTMLGALLCLVDSIEIFMLNMTYDIPVKLFAFHLILLSLFLLAADFKRLFHFLVLNRTIQPSTSLPMFKTRRATHIALAVQIILGLWILASNAYSSRQAWFKYGGGSPKSPLYGIWDVTEMSLDGVIRSPLLTDYGRWQRVIFDFPESISFQRMDGSVTSYGASINSDRKTIALTKNSGKTAAGNLTFDRQSSNPMTLAGTLGGHKIKMRLTLMDRSKFLLVNRGFHWIQEYPFNR